jgi:hypothetical protein
MAEQLPPPGGPRPWMATARALKVLIAAGRREREDKGAADPRTWEAIDELTDQLIESLPDPGRPRG